MVRKAKDVSSQAEALEVSLRLLQRAAQTEKGLREKLAKRQFELPTIDAVMAKLKNMQLIDDEKYARDYVAYRSRTSPLGKFNLRYKLMQKGISKDLAKSAAEEISAEQEVKLARELASKRLNALRRFTPEEQKLKLARFLAARGFSSQTVYTIILEQS